MGSALYSIQSEENVYDERVKGDDMATAIEYTGLLFGKICFNTGKTTFLKMERYLSTSPTVRNRQTPRFLISSLVAAMALNAGSEKRLSSI